MVSEFWLDVSYWVSLALAMPLLILSLMAVGKHVSDLQYQRAKHLNGIRWIQSWTNLRIHWNRVFFVFAFIISSVMGLVDVDVTVRTIVSRILFILVLISFLISALYDWVAENKQLKLLLKYEDTNNLPVIRMNIHKLTTLWNSYFGFIELHKIPTEDKMVMEELRDNITMTMRQVQEDVHAMDPSFMKSTAKVEVEVSDVKPTVRE